MTQSPVILRSCYRSDKRQPDADSEECYLGKIGDFLDDSLNSRYVYHMDDLKAAQDMMSAAVAARKETEDPEVTSVRQVLKLLDKAAKNARTFGQPNPVAQRFFQQFYEALTGHLLAYSSIILLVQRSELFFKDATVYGDSSDPSTENLAFRLYADGVRELTLREGLTEEDVAFFLDVLWTGADPSANEDDDIVTRLWDKGLPTITIVTADDVMKLSDTETVLNPQQGTSLNSPPSSLHDVVASEKTKQANETAGQSGRPTRIQTTGTGYDVSESELAALGDEINQESARDSITYVLEVLATILASEKSLALLGRLFDIYQDIVEALVRQGQWVVLEHVLCVLFESEAVRPDLIDEHKQKLRALFETLGSLDRIRLIEHYLNKTETPNTDGLGTILIMMPPASIPALCNLLGNLERPNHQAIVADALAALAKEQPEPLLKLLTDRRSGFVRQLLSVLSKWNNPRHADAIEKIVRYPDPIVRREVVRILGVLRPNGNGVKLIALLNDGDEGVRLASLKLLVSGNYSAPYSAWESLVTADEFGDRPHTEKRNLFHAMRATARNEAVPYLSGLLTDRGWTNRKKREDLALLAAETLGKLATPEAIAALEVGRQKGGAAVAQACAAAIATAARQHAKAS